MRPFAVLLLLFSVAWGQEFNIIDHGYTKEIEITIAQPEVKEIEVNNEKFSIVGLKNSEFVALLPNFLPYLNFLLVCPPNSNVDLIEVDFGEIEISAPLLVLKEKSFPYGVELSDAFNLGDRIYDFVYLGKMRGIDVCAFLFFPFKIEGQKLKYIKRAKFNIASPLLSKFDENVIFTGQKVDFLSPNLNLLQSGEEFEYKIFIRKDGVYKITYDELKKAGIDLKGVQASRLKLKNNGVEIPIYVYSGGDGVFNEGDYIEFYAEARKNKFSGGKIDLYNDPFTDVNVYFLEVGDSPGLRYAEESGTRHFENYIDLRGASYYHEVHLENDYIFERLKDADTDLTYDVRDHWFWVELGSNEQTELNVYIPKPDPLSLDEIKIRSAFHGVTSTRGHIANVFINNKRILTASWNGQNIQIASSENSGYSVPNSVLKDGLNKITVFNANDGRVENAIFAVNWFDLTYRRLYQADKDEIKFKIPPEYNSGYFRFEISGFKNPNISVYRLGVSKISNVEILKAKDDKIGENYHAIFYASVLSQDVEFIAVSELAKLKPDSIAKDLKTNLKSSANSFDYLIITHPILYDKFKEVSDQTHPLNRLKSLYESKGLSVKIVSVDDIYDEFNFGVKSPYAIKNFLRFAYNSWIKKPIYVLFVGGAVYDNRRYPMLDLVPTMFYQSYIYGATSADAWFTFIDGEDYLGDVLLGRLPVRDREEMKNAIEKIISYHNQKPQKWHRNVLMIAGEGREFESQTDYIVKNVLPKFLNINRLYVIPGSTFSGGTSKLLSYFNDGQLLINFVGHGGGAIWADNGLLKNEDIPKLANKDRYSFITSMTCFSGAFDYPQKTAIGVNLVVEKEKGAIGVLASSGLGWLLNDYFMLLSVLPYLYDSERSIGEAVTIGKARYYSNYFFWPQAKTMVYQYNYIGDPAVKLFVPSQRTKIEIERKILSINDTLKVKVSSRIQNGNAIISFADDEHVSKFEFERTIQSGDLNFEMKPPISSGFVKVFIYDDKKIESGFDVFKTSGSFVGDYTVSPSEPKVGDSLSFSGRVEMEGGGSPDSVKFIVLKYKSGYGRFDQLFGRDTILCFPLKANFYQTAVKVRAEAGLKYIIQMTAYVSGKAISGEIKEFVIGGLPDPSLLPMELNNLQSSIYMKSQNLKFKVDSTVKITARIYNLSDVPANDFKIKFYDGLRDENYVIAQSRFSIAPLSYADVEVELQKQIAMGSHRIFAVIESDQTSGDDLDYSNNVTYNELVYNFVRFNSDSISISEGLSLKRDNPFVNVIGFEYPVSTFSPTQSFLHQLNVYGESGAFLARYEPLGNNSVEIFAKLDTSDQDVRGNKDKIRLYYFDEKIKRFRIKNSKFDGQWLSGKLDEPGVYTIGYSNDARPPRVEVTVEGQSFRDGAYVSANPVFSILIEDDEGVDLSDGSFRFKIDGKDLKHSDITIPDTVSNPKSLFVKVNPKLTDGEHSASFSARDVNGNWSDEVKVSFKVSSNFEVKVYGNFPNPFSDRTFFAYEILGSQVEEVEFKIYTVAGRLIQSFKFPSGDPLEVYGFQVGGTGIPTAIGYHEIWWDGTDRDGNEVANGVYFYKFSVKRDGKVQSYTGKIARVR